jgi:hypothetical protein
MNVRALAVGHSPKAVLPYGVLLIPNWEMCDWQCCCSSEAPLTQVSKSVVCHHLDSAVGLATNDGPRPWRCGDDGDRHVDLARVQAMGTSGSVGPWNKASHP